MYVILWRFRAAPGQRDAFIRAYGRDGDWAALFRRGEGYLGTELWRDAVDLDRFLVIDRWEDAGRYDAFRTRFAAEYDELDRACAVLTAEETPVGRYHVDLQTPINGTAG